MLVDGAFFLQRVKRSNGQTVKRLSGGVTPIEAADAVAHLADRHLAVSRRDLSTLYRVFFYDCPPLRRKRHNPVTGRSLDFSKSDVAVYCDELHAELVRRPKVALRRGYLDEDYGRWVFTEPAMKDLLRGSRSRDDLLAEDVRYETRQKGVDMRIGLDIASLAYKRQVDQIVLVAGDSDFVPAAKLARREGIEFLLDPLGASIRGDLHEHVDDVRNLPLKK